jgi:hypothetical protein
MFYTEVITCVLYNYYMYIAQYLHGYYALIICVFFHGDSKCSTQKLHVYWKVIAGVS